MLTVRRRKCPRFAQPTDTFLHSPGVCWNTVPRPPSQVDSDTSLAGWELKTGIRDDSGEGQHEAIEAE